MLSRGGLDGRGCTAAICCDCNGQYLTDTRSEADLTRSTPRPGGYMGIGLVGRTRKTGSLSFVLGSVSCWTEGGRPSGALWVSSNLFN